MSQPLVQVAGITKDFRTGGDMFRRVRIVRALRGVNLDVHRGETVALVGESGSGKSTLGRILLRLLDPSSGTVHFDGIDVFSLKREPLRRLRRRMQIVFQDSYGSLNPRMRIGNAVGEPLEIHRLASGTALQERVGELFDEVGLDPSYLNRYPHELSGGQRQRVGIARALAVGPDFVVLDEPVSALDVSVQAQVLNLLTELRDRRTLTYLFIAHDLAVVRHLATRVVVLYGGRVMETAPVAPLYESPAHPYTTALLDAVPVPDPTVARKRIAVTKGEIAGDGPTGGCVFASRCTHPSKDDRCRIEQPTLVELGGGRTAACHYVDVSTKE
jgi:oligopeptide/dipeptide ABC transporter ATP-binding protein